MIGLKVVRDSSGWSVQIDDHMKSPFRRRDAAIAEAHRIAADIRRHGEQAEVTVEDDFSGEGGAPASAGEDRKGDERSDQGRPFGLWGDSDHERRPG